MASDTALAGIVSELRQLNTNIQKLVQEVQALRMTVAAKK